MAPARLKCKSVHDIVIETMKLYNELLFPDTPEHLRGSLIHCGHEEVSYRYYCWDGMARGNQEFSIWQYTLAGEGALKIGDQLSAVRPGMAMLLTVPERHCYYLPRHSKYWEFLYISVYGSELLRLFNEFRRRHGSLCHFEPDARVVACARDIVAGCGSGRIHDSYTASAASYRFVMELCASVPGGVVNRDERLLGRIQHYCQKNVHRQISVTELAELIGCTRSYFSRRFREIAHTTPNEFILSLRLKKAVNKLQAGNITIKDIAAGCGFTSTSYFCRVFQRAYGMSPKAFQHGRLGGEDEI